MMPANQVHQVTNNMINDQQIVDLRLSNNFGYEWVFAGQLAAKGVAHLGEKVLHGKQLLEYFSEADSEATLKNMLADLNGSFAVAGRRGDFLFAATDRLRSFPLFYYKVGSTICVVDQILTARECEQFDPDVGSSYVFLKCGYTIGSRTLLRDVQQLQAGQCLVLKSGEPSVSYYYRHFHRQDKGSKQPNESAEKQIREISARVFQRLISSCAGKEMAVPLSGGYDSRYVVALLKMLGAEDVVCYTYGRPESFEVEISKKVAEKLGYKWQFVEYRDEMWPEYLEDTDMIEMASNCSSLPVSQEYLAVKSLRDRGFLHDDSVIVPGFCGDLLGGSYIPKSIIQGEFAALNRREMARHIIAQQFQFANPVEDPTILASQIMADLSRDTFDTESKFISHNEEFFTRHKVAKYVMNAVRIYEYLGFQWRTPLWDNELVSFWYGVDYQERLDKSLYERTLFELFFEPNDIALRKSLASEMDKLLGTGRLARFTDKYLRSHISRIWRRFLRPNGYDDYNNYKALYGAIRGDVAGPHCEFNGSATPLFARWYLENLALANVSNNS